tara:strand:- start:1742 stop:1990 length:249 start_codon:yes stop_codon:yes gene_type:complete
LQVVIPLAGLEISFPKKGYKDDPFTVNSKGFNWVHIELTPIINNAIYSAFSLNQLKQLKSKVKFSIGVCTDFPLAVPDIFND